MAVTHGSDHLKRLPCQAETSVSPKSAAGATQGRCRIFASNARMVAASPAWMRSAAARSPAPCSPPPWSFPQGVPRRLARLIDDSKRLTAEQRGAAYAALLASGAAEIGVGAASVAEIARLNILHAALLAMCRAVARLPAVPDLALIDGDRPPPMPAPERLRASAATATSLSIAAASIVAKVLRDRAMARLAARCPGYGWETNCRATARSAHRAALARLGPPATIAPPSARCACCCWTSASAAG